MAPREQGDVSTAHVHDVVREIAGDSCGAVCTFKVVDRAMEIPVVNDAWSAATSLTSACPYVDSMCSCVKHTASNLGCKAEDILPEGVKDKVQSVVSSLDSLACTGLCKLTHYIPRLTTPTPELLKDAKESTCSFIGATTEYLASFQLSQLSLRVGDRGLQKLEAVMQSVGVSDSMVKRLRRGAKAVRRAGARRAGLDKPTWMGALTEILGINVLLTALGLELVYTKEARSSRKVNLSLGLAETVSESEGDLDYCPSEGSSDSSLEYDSDNEKCIYEDEHAQVLVEDTGDEGESSVINAADYDCSGGCTNALNNNKEDRMHKSEDKTVVK